MGSAQTKDIITPTTTPVKVQEQITEHTFISPIHKAISSASSVEDPRSPGGRRTPLHSPHSTPNLNKNVRDRMMMRLASKQSTQDPRSPSLINRTPLQLSAVDGVPRTPPPFRSEDPRSPSTARTPLALSTQGATTAPDLLIVGQEIASEHVVFAEEIVMEEGKKEEDTPIGGAPVENIIETSACVDTMSAKVTTENFNSPGISEELIAFATSSLNSPSLGRKRKDIARTPPLKKSYSAPMDENTPPSPPLNKTIASAARPRAPLSPLSQRAINSINSRYCVGVQPIKFRMDPGILG